MKDIEELQIAIVHHFEKVLPGNLLKVESTSDNLDSVVNVTNIMKMSSKYQ
jgi:hypothetical protein